jgi:hypothetical protein
MQANSTNGGTVQIHADKLNGPLIGKVTVIPGKNWQLVAGRLAKPTPGVHDLFFVLTNAGPVDIDWVTFK